jgi:hypothetical protein
MTEKKQSKPLLLTKKRLVSLLRNRVFLSASISLVFFLLILPINERVAFAQPAPEHATFAILLKIGFLGALFIGVYGLLSFIAGLRRRDAFYRSWLKYSAAYGIVATTFFLLLYPGHWVWDEFNILYAVQHYVPDAWQNIYTNIYYTFSLYLVPTGVSIVAFQGVIASLAVGYILTRSESFTKSRVWRIVFFAIFLLPPVIINNLYPLRLTVYSYLEVVFLVRLLLLLLNKERLTNTSLYFLQMTVFIVFLAFWRSEGIYYLLLLPVIAHKLGFLRRSSWQHLAVPLTIAGSIVLVLSGYLINKTASNDRYGLTAMINPLSIMIQSPLKGENIEERLRNIDKVINLQVLRENPSYTEIPAFWAGAVRDNYQDNLGLFQKEYLRLVLDNPDLFLRARAKTFLATNAFDVTTPTPLGMLSFSSYSDPHSAEVVERFYETNFLSKPINVSIKYNITRGLLFLDKNDHVSPLGRVFWSVIPAIILVGVALITSAVRRQWAWVLIFSLIMVRAAILFLTAPAHYFMYYLPVFISGLFIGLLWVSHHDFGARKAKRGA